MSDDEFVKTALVRGIDTSCPLARPTSEPMDNILGHVLPVLDHGFIRLIDYMGTDLSIVQAARVSYGAGTKTISEDQGLINYLMRHQHTTPFEMCEIKVHVKLPVFVARQWIRHRMANVNEYSARYSILDKEFYFPEPDVLASQSSVNGQGRDENTEYMEADAVLSILHQACDEAYADYEHLHTVGSYEDFEGFVLTGKALSRELSRIILPMNIYTQWYWKTDLHNLFRFLKLRMDTHAQYEIRVYADLIGSIVKDWVPMAASAFENYQLNSMTFSKAELMMLHSMMESIPYNTDALGMSKGEVLEFKQKLIKMKALA